MALNGSKDLLCSSFFVSIGLIPGTKVIIFFLILFIIPRSCGASIKPDVLFFKELFINLYRKF